jgi:mannose-6-phosphate isomerase-like protein (cupin superfamily)
VAKFTVFQADERPPTIPKPDHPVDPQILTVREGVPILFPGCDGTAVRVVHPTNPNAQSRNHGVTMVYLPPHTSLPSGSHETEETYAILTGTGRMSFEAFERDVGPGDFVYLPPWCVHGLENTGTEVLTLLVTTSPPNP